MSEIQLFFIWAACMMFLLFLYTTGQYMDARRESKFAKHRLIQSINCQSAFINGFSKGFGKWPMLTNVSRVLVTAMKTRKFLVVENVFRLITLRRKCNLDCGKHKTFNKTCMMCMVELEEYIQEVIDKWRIASSVTSQGVIIWQLSFQMGYALHIFGGLYLVKCIICLKDIHTDHTEGELMKCLSRSADYQTRIMKIVADLKVLIDWKEKYGLVLIVWKIMIMSP